MLSSQEHFPVILSTSSHIDSLPIKSTTLISELSIDNLEFILFMVSTTILCCDCLPVRNMICFGLSLLLAISKVDAKEAAVFPIPVGAAAKRKPPLLRTSIPSKIIFS